MRKPRTTLAEVAQEAGVSVGTVSKVLNNKTDISEATRSRVRRALRESAYEPQQREARTADPHRGLIDVVFYHWQNAYTITVLDGVTAAAEAEGFRVVVSPFRLDHPVDLDPNVMIKSGHVGAIFINFDAGLDPVRSLIDSGFPVVVVDPLQVGKSECVSVGSTNFNGGVTATEYVLSLGHRRIAHAGGPSTVTCSHARLAGQISALRQAGVTFDESLVTHSEFSYQGGRDVAAVLLDRPDRPTAVFAGCDEIGLGIMEEARRRSIRVPEDLSIIGFDDTFLAAQSTPPLTTIAQPLLDMGRLATRTLSQMMTDDGQVPRHVELATHLVIRDSTTWVGPLKGPAPLS